MPKTVTAGMFKAAAFALLALGASALVVLPAAAHSPLAVDQQGQSCV